MPASVESEALTRLFKEFVAQFPADGDIYNQRAVYDGIHRAASEVPGTTYEDVTIKHAGLSVDCKWVRPANASTENAILFFHGGGYSFGSTASHRKMCAHLAAACGASALMVEYRRAPEVPYPGALDDCVAAYGYLVEGQKIPSKRIVTMGDSCGGDLATTVVLSAMRRGLPPPAAAVALSPCYDLVGRDSESMRSNAQVDVLQTAEFCDLLAERYAGGPEKLHLLREPVLSAIYVDEQEMKKLPPHYISCGGHDMLLNDGTRMAEKLRQGGIEVQLDVLEEMQHVCEFMAGKAPEADGSIKRIGQWVRQKLSS